MTNTSLQDLCAQGQSQLIETQYLKAEATLETAERLALAAGDWDALSRLYMPLQEARRQRRQRCGEGMVRLDLLSAGPADHLSARHALENYAHGQLLVAGWGSIEPAVQVRTAAAAKGLYVETFLGAAYPINGGRVVVLAPTDDVLLPPPEPRSLEALVALLPSGSVILTEEEIPEGPRQGSYHTYGEVMAIWERLHAPFLKAADVEPDLVRRIAAYRQTIRVDYACELAHQRLSNVARELDRNSVNLNGTAR